MQVLAIDPGPVESAYVILSGTDIQESGKVPNDDILAVIRRTDCPIAIELYSNYGSLMGQTSIWTCIWTGRFIEAGGGHDNVECVPRKTVVTHLTGSSRSGDSEVRKCMIARYGGQEKAIGRQPKNKRERESGVQPGPLHGVAGDVWSALAIGTYWTDMQRVRGAAA